MSRLITSAGACYFGLVFGAGFVLGFFRVLLLVPRMGERAAELLEMPLMLVAVYLSASWVVRRFAVPPGSSCRVGIGFFALALLLITEFTVVLGLRGLTLAEYWAERDPIAGIVYCVMLIIFALMPLLVVRR